MFYLDVRKLFILICLVYEILLDLNSTDELILMMFMHYYFLYTLRYEKFNMNTSFPQRKEFDHVTIMFTSLLCAALGSPKLQLVLSQNENCIMSRM